MAPCRARRRSSLRIGEDMSNEAAQLRDELERFRVSHTRLRVSHTRLLAAATFTVNYLERLTAGKVSLETLKAAIAEAEQL